MSFDELHEEFNEMLEIKVKEVYADRFQKLSTQARKSNMNYLALLLERMAESVDDGNVTLLEMNKDLQSFGYELMVKQPAVQPLDDISEMLEAIEKIEFHLVEKIFVAK